ncbi:hypothetical protein TSUD_291920 [Trifolium subterraneum]|uniref:Uncharacterized protein n=1 Tax=Trifolium subterraneum TaxID=3900 RepID=A0A2Z6NYG7_TRISU|nr:hypothetical protein TSUD_291920 [Trifolium subterraneum]
MSVALKEEKKAKPLAAVTKSSYSLTGKTCYCKNRIILSQLRSKFPIEEQREQRQQIWQQQDDKPSSLNQAKVKSGSRNDSYSIKVVSYLLVVGQEKQLHKQASFARLK